LKKKNIVSILKYLFFLAIGLGLLYYITKDYFKDASKLDVLVNSFKSANYYWVLLAMLAGAISHIFRAARWNLIINSTGHKTKLSTTFYAVMIGYFANMLVPRLGEISRCGVLNKHTKVPFNVLLGTVVAERILDSFCLLFLAFLVVFFQYAFLKEFLAKYLAIDYSMNQIIFLGVAAIILIVIIYVLYKTMNKRLKNKPFYQKIKRILIGFFEGLKAIKDVKQKWAFLFHTLMIWVMYFFMTYLCFFALNSTSHLGISAGLTILVLGSIGIVAPVPGGTGTYHAVVIVTMVELFKLNIDAAATPFAFISHTSQGLLISALALLSVIMLFISNKKSKAVHEKPKHD